MEQDRDELETVEITSDTDAEDGEPAGQDATPDVREDSVAEFESDAGVETNGVEGENP